jgi:predicted porin
MQKKLIALAVAGLVSGGAFAQSNVTISGALDLGFESVASKGGAAGTDATSRSRITNNTSWLRFSGAEDLGGGLKAVFQIEQDVNGDTGSATGIASRNTYVGLAGNFGTALIGRYDVHYTSHMAGVDDGSNGAIPHAANTLNMVGEYNGTLIGGRLDNVIAYVSPSFGGLTAQFGYTTMSEATTAGLPAKDSAYNLYLRYGNGPISAIWSSTKVSNSGNTTAAAGDITANRLGAAYNFGIVKVGVIYDDTEIGTASRTAWGLPITFTMGPNRVYFEYSKAGAIEGMANSAAKNYALAYTYDLSKRTQLGVSYSKITNEANAKYDFWTRGVGNVANGSDPSSFYAGVYHSF